MRGVEKGQQGLLELKETMAWRAHRVREERGEIQDLMGFKDHAANQEKKD